MEPGELENFVNAAHSLEKLQADIETEIEMLGQQLKAKREEQAALRTAVALLNRRSGD